jgi:thioredoxin-like negative regulator of GroEL
MRHFAAGDPSKSAARVAMLTLFAAFGPQHELTREFRRRLQIVL